MKCHICGEREATIHYIEIIEGQKTSQWLCHECADREGITPGDDATAAHGALDAFLGEMLKSAPQERARERGTEGPTCPTCGYEYRRLQASGMLGCPDCYVAFRRQLLPMLRRYHGDVSHVGKLPRAHGPRAALRREIAQLKALLEQAVGQESYEEAARLRDVIRQQERLTESLDRSVDTAGEDGSSGPPRGEA